MMTVKDFVAQNAVWHRLTPALEQFTRWMNRYGTHGVSAIGYPLPSAARSDRRSVVAEAAFSGLGSADSIWGLPRFGRMPLLTRLLEPAARSASLDQAELAEAVALLDRLIEFLSGYEFEDLRFKPVVRGCGVVLSTECDILSGSGLLVEVKSVDRSFRGSDLRQVLTYSAMLNSAGGSISQVCLLNPRAGNFFMSSSGRLAKDLGSGSWIELMHDLQQEMSDPIGTSS